MSHRHRFHHHRHHHGHPHHLRVALVINGDFAVELIPNGVIHITKYEADSSYIENGQQIVAPVFDAPPEWADLNPAAQTLTPAQDGLTASALGLDAGGTDTVRMTCSIGGTSFTATVDGTINPGVPKQVPTTVNIVATPA